MAKKRKYQTLYNRYDTDSSDTRWAEREEIENSLTKIDFAENSLPGGGVPFISDGKIAFVDTSDHHSIIFGQSGSKKTRNIAFPQTLSLIKAGESIIILDYKGENFNLTSGIAKSMGYDVYVLNIRSPYNSHRWNPLAEPWRLLHEENNIDRSRELLADFVQTYFVPEAKSMDPYWEESAASLAMGLCNILVTCADFEEATIKSLMFMRSSGINMDAEGYLVALTDELPRDSFTYQNLSVSFTAPDRTRSCIISVFDSKLRLFAAQPGITELFSASDFDIRKFGEKKTVLYIIAPDERTAYAKLITTFIQQSFQILIDYASSKPDLKLPLRVNYILDEFAQLPRINSFVTAIGTARSRNIRFTLFVQSLNQLVSTYGDDAETILGNTANTIFLSSREVPLLERLSALCGRFSNGDYLISPSRLQRLKSAEKGEALVLLTSNHPYISNLVDISQYEFERIPPLTIEKRTDVSPLFELRDHTDRLDWLVQNESVLSSEEDDDDEDEQEDDDSDMGEYDIQEELRRKFDELFGTDVSDSSDDD